MATPAEQWMRTVARKLGDLRDQTLFLGGAVLGLLLEVDPIGGVRVTDDVDVVIDVPSRQSYAQLEERLRARGFQPDTSEDAPLCRWVVDGVVVDIMPTDAAILGFTNRWYAEGYARAESCELEPGLVVRVVSAPYFVATKLEAFFGRGQGDYMASHDLEDVIAIIDGRATLVTEVRAASAALQDYVRDTFARLLATPAFVDAIAGHLSGDEASQARRPIVLDRLHDLASTPGTITSFRTTPRNPMAIKKSELYSSLWKSCDELRGGMDASQYKDYVLVLLFVKYVSDKAASQKGYDLEVPKGGSFADMVALKGDKEIGDKMNKIIRKLAERNELTGVIDLADWNDPDKLGKGAEMVARLTNLVSIFDNPALDFRGNRADGDDLLGDAYEYLMRHFATESGKSKGQFYTPAEVSRVMAKVIGVGSAEHANQTIHDPTCGSGSLLLKAHDEAKTATGLDLAVYGQEKDNATRALARMNIILHNCATGVIWQDNTLSTPYFKDAKTGALKTFDFVVSNPPFSDKAWTNGLDPVNDLFGRFAFGVPPKKNGDYAFLLHVLACLKSTGRGAIILPHGVLFRGGAEASIRREIVRRGYLKGIIGLPANLFYGTGIPACILVLDKEGAAGRKGIFMIDASRGFIKDGPKNRLRAQDLHKIVDAFTRQLELPRYARMVPLAEISDDRNGFNLNLPRYIDASEPEDLQDIDGHLRGGIPERDLDALDRYWKVFPGVRSALFQPDRPGYAALKVAASDINSTIFGHAEFTSWSTRTKKLFAAWRTDAAPRLRALKQGDQPKPLIEGLAESLLAAFGKAKLLDAYDIYQHLMDYWAESMEDDVHLIASDGWLEAAKPRLLVEDKDSKDKKSKERPDFSIGKKKFKAELIPTPLLVARYFAADQAVVDTLESAAAVAVQELEELVEEHGGEDGLLADARNDKDKVTKASVAARLKVVKDDPDPDERAVLDDYLARTDNESAISAKLKAAQDVLTGKIAAQYGRLTEGDIKALVVDDKWLAKIESAVQGELDRMSRTLSGRVRELADRYAKPLPALTAELSMVTARVDAHLKRMGAVW